MICISRPAFAVIETYQFDSNEEQQRFQRLSDELRCPKCQNTNLSGSDAGLATDLRRIVSQMIQEGRTDKEIVQFMFTRYGDFILYRPRLTLATSALWFGPWVFLALGFWVLSRLLKRGRQPDAEQALTDTEQKTLADILSLQEPSAGKEPSAGEEPSANNEEPSAGEEPSAHK